MLPLRPIPNATPITGGVHRYDELTRSATLRWSYPCNNPPPSWRERCSQVDGKPNAWAPHWAAIGVSFNRFALAEQKASATVDVYNIHAPFIPDTDSVSDLELVADAVKSLEGKIPPAPGARLFPRR